MKLNMPCWSGMVNVVVYVVEFAVDTDGSRRRRWNGESMENSSCRSSPASGVNGMNLSHEYSESSIA